MSVRPTPGAPPADVPTAGPGRPADGGAPLVGTLKERRLAEPPPGTLGGAPTGTAYRERLAGMVDEALADLWRRAVGKLGVSAPYLLDEVFKAAATRRDRVAGEKPNPALHDAPRRQRGDPFAAFDRSDGQGDWIGYVLKSWMRDLLSNPVRFQFLQSGREADCEVNRTAAAFWLARVGGTAMEGQTEFDDAAVGPNQLLIGRLGD